MEKKMGFPRENYLNTEDQTFINPIDRCYKQIAKEIAEHKDEWIKDVLEKCGIENLDGDISDILKEMHQKNVVIERDMENQCDLIIKDGTIVAFWDNGYTLTTSENQIDVNGNFWAFREGY